MFLYGSTHAEKINAFKKVLEKIKNNYIECSSNYELLNITSIVSSDIKLLRQFSMCETPLQLENLIGNIKDSRTIS